MHRLTLATSLAALVLAAGCASSTQTAAPAQRVENPAAGTVERPSNLSYGTVTATVKKNVTTQAELIDLFGGPNISTTDSDGVETWVYERTSSTTDTAGNAEAKNFEAFFGAGASAGPVVAGGGVSGGTRSNSDQRRTVNSIRTLTVVVKFNPNKTVKDCTARASYF
jgi:opacity protein-like surface antigen